MGYLTRTPPSLPFTSCPSNAPPHLSSTLVERPAVFPIRSWQGLLPRALDPGLLLQLLSFPEMWVSQNRDGEF